MRFMAPMAAPSQMPTQIPDAAKLASYLREKGLIATDSVVLEKFAGGQSNPTFKLTAGEKNFVLRRKPLGNLLPSAHAVDREYRVMTALGKTAFPVPKTYVLCQDPSVIGSDFFIMDMVEGRIFWDQSLPDVSKADRTAIYGEMNRVIALLHKTDYAAIGLGDYGKPGNYFARQIKRWSEQYRASETETIPAMNELIAWLPQNIPAGDETSIVHGDFRIDNIIFHPTEPRALAVLDWELSTLGHPLADFSYHCLSWYIPPGDISGLAGVDIAALGIPAMQEYVAAYCKHTGRARVDNWNFYIAFNLFRLSAIFQGIAKRALDGTASSDQAVSRGKMARPIAELGWKQVTG
jgi:aminoglycoside phosphotransferase (APT) family kinase protein